jgi:hypothetical protein
MTATRSATLAKDEPAPPVMLPADMVASTQPHPFEPGAHASLATADGA